jgi:hypothetical protein
MDLPKGTGGASPGTGGRAAGGAAADFLSQGGGPASQRAGGARAPIGAGNTGIGRANVAANPAGRAQNAAGNRAGRIENRGEWQQNRDQRADEIRNEFNDNHPVADFWSDNPGWAAMRITRPFRWASWGAVGAWGGYGAESSYNYGEDVYYQDGAVYSGEQQVATEEEYAQQAEDLAANAPDTPASDMEWMPLGVFALTQDGQATGAEPTLFLQLALSKQGVIAGTFENKTSGEKQTLEGMVDKASQRAAWGIVDKQRPIVETGIANLTKDSAPALIHFADGQTQQWLLVRLNDPSEKK